MFRSGRYMLCLWVGTITMSLVYLFGLPEVHQNAEHFPFVFGQLVLGIMGAGRERYLSTKT